MKNKNGFTLVELLAVIVILALLMVVSARTIGSSLTDSKRNAIVAESNKLMLYAIDDLKMHLVNNNTLDNYTAKVTKVGKYYIYILKESDYNGYAIFDGDVNIVGYCLDYNKNSYGKAEFVIGADYYMSPDADFNTLEVSDIIDNRCCNYSTDSGEVRIDMTTNNCI